MFSKSLKKSTTKALTSSKAITIPSKISFNKESQIHNEQSVEVDMFRDVMKPEEAWKSPMKMSYHYVGYNSTVLSDPEYESHGSFMKIAYKNYISGLGKADKQSDGK